MLKLAALALMLGCLSPLAAWAHPSSPPAPSDTFMLRPLPPLPLPPLHWPPRHWSPLPGPIGRTHGHVHNAPAPLLAAGLPAFAMLGGAGVLTGMLRRRRAIKGA